MNYISTPGATLSGIGLQLRQRRCVAEAGQVAVLLPVPQRLFRRRSFGGPARPSPVPPNLESLMPLAAPGLMMKMAIIALDASSAPLTGFGVSSLSIG
jgi:hypothetical protein